MTKPKRKPAVTDAQLLTAALTASGLSVNKFAEYIGYSVRTVKYWRARGAKLKLNQRARFALIGVVETAKDDIATVLGPAPWASYLVNGDASGLREGEEAQADRWLASHAIPGFIAYVVGIEGESYFANYSPGLETITGYRAGDCVDYLIDLQRAPKPK